MKAERAPANPSTKALLVEELTRGLSWNEFQKFYRGFQNAEVASRWSLYNLLLPGGGPAKTRAEQEEPYVAGI